MNNSKYKIFIIILVVVLSFGVVCTVSGCGDPYSSLVDESVDIDLTAMTETVAYSQIYKVYSSPTYYVGQTIKVEGYVYVSGSSYYICVLDATKCCTVKVQFDANGSLASCQTDDKVCMIGTIGYKSNICYFFDCYEV